MAPRKKKKSEVVEEVKIIDPITDVTDVTEVVTRTEETVEVKEGREGNTVVTLEFEAEPIIMKVIKGRFESFEKKRIEVPKGLRAILLNEGAGDIYIEGYDKRYIRRGESYEKEEGVLELMAPSRPFYRITFYKK